MILRGQKAARTRRLRAAGRKTALVRTDEKLTAFLELERVCRLLLLTFEKSDVFVRATGVNRDAGELPTLRSLCIRLIEEVRCIRRRDHLVFPLVAARRRPRTWSWGWARTGSRLVQKSDRKDRMNFKVIRSPSYLPVRPIEKADPRDFYQSIGSAIPIDAFGFWMISPTWARLGLSRSSRYGFHDLHGRMFEKRQVHRARP
jgi:hypothetical protein